MWILLEGDEAGGVGGTDTGATVLHGLVGQGELTEVVADHLTLDFHSVELLAVVDANDGANHLGHHDHVAEVGADSLGLLADLHVLLRLAELLDQRHRLALQATLEATAGTGVDKARELLVLQLQELLDLEAAEGELVEGAGLLQLLVALLVDVGHAGLYWITERRKHSAQSVRIPTVHG